VKIEQLHQLNFKKCAYAKSLVKRTHEHLVVHIDFIQSNRGLSLVEESVPVMVSRREVVRELLSQHFY